MPKLSIKTFKIPCQKTTINKYDMILVKTSTNEYCYVYTGSQWNAIDEGNDLQLTVEIQNGYLNLQIQYTFPNQAPTKSAYIPFNWI